MIWMKPAANFDPKPFLESLTTRPGVYQMLNTEGKVIYVGKARNLRKRVSSYFNKDHKESPKTRVMVKLIADIQVITTHTENEALILENNLIKELRPKYNIWFRDDKSYPYIYLSSEHKYPRLTYYRGARRGKGQYFGPYPGAISAKKTINLIQKLFQLRSCKDSFFKNRSRPCLQYQIKRCSAPCVDYISTQDYQRDVQHAVMFMQGKNEAVIDALTVPMQEASERQDYERAAQYRDQIINLRKVQEHQYISKEQGDFDIIACQQNAGTCALVVIFIRGGLNLGNKVWYQKQDEHTSAEIIEAFISQYYLDESIPRDIPNEIICGEKLSDSKLIENVLMEKRGKKVQIKFTPKGERARWLKMANDNASISLQQKISLQSSKQDQLAKLQDLLHMEDTPARIECFDISHTQGEATVASCVVFDEGNMVSAQYRRFNITGIKPGDDYAAMSQALQRRYTRVQKEEGKLPDIILIDGGKGQVSTARAVMEELQLAEIPLVGVAKGPARRPGQETLVLDNENKMINLGPDSPVLHLIQNIRDEAHRFAITGHRQRRKKARNYSTLEDIEGIGTMRRQNLIRHFGGIQGVIRAGVDDLARVPGINRNLAQKIYDNFH